MRGSEDPITLMTSARIQRSLKRMAYEINERNKEDYPILLLGINKRGFAVARGLSAALSDILEEQVEAQPLKLEENAASGWCRDNKMPHFVVLVDDVIFSGRTMFRALKKVAEQLNPTEIHTVVLIDRGHRKYPVQAEFYGMELPTKLGEHVTVKVEERVPQSVQLTHA